MRITEIFYSVQGEGELTGVPSVFIRTAGCNLRCTWCDTKYASWTPESGALTVEEIVSETLKHPAGHVVLTGGEPMLAPELPELAARLRAAGKHVTIETAGTIPPGGIECDLASLSPKLRNSTPAPGEISSGWIERHEKTRIQPAVLREWLRGYPFQLKFVLATEPDLKEIDEVLLELSLAVPPWKVLLMPEGVDAPALSAHAGLALRICKERGFRYCDRLHIALFGHQRGT